MKNSNKQRLLFFDSTLRDGSHAIAHKLSKANIRDYCRIIDQAGLEVVIVGHGNGLGASSLQVGLSALTDLEMLRTARRQLKKTKLGAFLIPGFGTIKDDLEPALRAGVDLVCVGCHCTEADTTQQHIQYTLKAGHEAYGVLMMYHMISKEVVLEEALKMQEYGAQGIILMDSAGASTPQMVKETVELLVDNLNVRVGFHAHNNLGLAVSNSLIALESGATIIDGTARGFGAGAGNCPQEILVGLLSKINTKTGLDLYKLMDASDLVSQIQLRPQEISSESLSSGMAGVFSAFGPPVKRAAAKFKVDSRDIFKELGRRKMVAGQEDFIVDIAAKLARKKGVAR